MTLSAPGTEWINQAEAVAASWPDRTLQAVMARFPYPPERNVRQADWAILVAHVSTRRDEDPILCAERLASYCHAWAERYSQREPTLEAIRKTQERTSDG